MINRILLSGNIAGCGKTTTAQYLSDKYGFKELYFAAPIYDIAREYFGMKHKNRKLLQDIGEKFREIRNSVWVDYLFNKVDRYTNVCISDCRRENEFTKAIDNDFLHIRIVCDRETAIRRMYERDGYVDESLLDNESEVGSRNLPAYEITNNGTFKELFDKVDWVLQQEWQGYINQMKMEQFYRRYC
jgi:dephospho-CoA kinase